MKWVKPLGNMLIPAVVFNIVYNTMGIIPAIVISLVCSLFSVIYFKIKNKDIKNSQIIGMLGLAVSAAAIIFSGDEKLYYVPSIFQNMLLLGFTVTLSLKHKSILHYLAKDFEIRSLERIPEEDMKSINIIWIIYFALKMIIKIVGILYLDFNILYWIVFLQGDPMMILMIILSSILIRVQYAKAGGKGE